MSAEQRHLARVCLGAPGVWTRRLLSAVLASSPEHEQPGVESAEVAGKGKAHTERGAVTAGANGTKRSKRKADDKRDDGATSLVAGRAPLPMHLMSALVQASTAAAGSTVISDSASGAGSSGGAAAEQQAASNGAQGAVRSDADAASSSSRLFEELSAQLAAWSRPAPAAVPSGGQHGVEAASGGGAAGGGKWRRVHEWQPCPIGVILGNVPHLEVAGAEARMHHAQPAQHSAPLAGSALGPSGGGSGHDVDMSDCRSDAWAVGVEAGGAGHEHAGYAGYEGYGDAYGQTGHEPLEAVQPPTAPRNVQGGVRIGSVGDVVGEGYTTIHVCMYI
eukprot:Tamp_18100.p1 GENE.Tamp_18100~~Tamp_18100.p1  ORF type:complete len:361 (-),score=61.41 Tamp_18100:263-1261(-)